MGNCCCNRIHKTENIAENLIIEQYSSLQIRDINFDDMDEHLKEILGVSLLDIPHNDLHKWISQSHYKQIVEKYLLFPNSFEDVREKEITSSYLKLNSFCCPTYEDVVKDSKNKNNKNNFFLWLICVTKLSSSTKKTKLIEKYILGTHKMLTFNTFKIFLRSYIYYNLCVTTRNFTLSTDIYNDKDFSEELNLLIEFVYTKENIEEYCDNLCFKMSQKILRPSDDNILTKIKRDISNEYIKTSQIIKFFKENLYLLDVFELRNNFFNLYSSKAEENITKIHNSF